MPTRSLAPRSLSRRIRPIALASLMAVSAWPAQAVVLPATGTLSLELYVLPPVVIPSVGSGYAVVNGSASAGHLTSLYVPPSFFSASDQLVPITDPLAYPFVGLTAAVDNDAGAFAGVGGAGFGGPMGLSGGVKVCLFGSSCSSAVANVVVPLSVVGAGGAAYHDANPVNLTVVGAPWTTGTVAVGTITRMGAVSPASNTGAPSGVITLVTPIFISTSVAPYQVFPSFASMTLHFVPEPATLVLLGAGVAGLVAFGGRRARA